MSIDAKVNYVSINEDGSGILHLVDRNKNSIAGQKKLYFDSAPENITMLNGRDIWGSSNIILLGDKKIANREGYTKINFIVTTLVI